MDFAVFGVHVLGVSSILNSINTVGTILGGRRKYSIMPKLSLFV